MDNKLNTFQRVRELEGWHAIAFAATLIERMKPNYDLFCQVTEFADPSQFAKSLNAVWEKLSTPKAKINFAVQLEKVEDVTPDSVDFDTYGVFPAIDASISLASTIMLIMEEEPQGAVITSKLSQGCVEAFVEATTEQELTPQDIKAHPLMQWEVGFQQELLDNLQNMQPGAKSCQILKAMATEDGVSNIGIEIN